MFAFFSRTSVFETVNVHSSDKVFVYFVFVNRRVNVGGSLFFVQHVQLKNKKHFRCFNLSKGTKQNKTTHVKAR